MMGVFLPYHKIKGMTLEWKVLLPHNIPEKVASWMGPCIGLMKRVQKFLFKIGWAAVKGIEIFVI